MPSRICRVASCRTRIPYEDIYCEKHQATNDKTYNSHIRSNVENKKYNEFYHTNQWRLKRKEKLMLTPLCEVCLREDKVRTKADMVHHKVDIRSPYGWKLRLDIDNLESICYAHHNKEDHVWSYNRIGK